MKGTVRVTNNESTIVIYEILKNFELKKPHKIIS